MSLETAMKALSTPTPEVAPTAAPQQQAISQNEVAAATVELETKAKNDAKIADSATTNKDSGVDAKVAETSNLLETKKEDPLSAKFSALSKKEKAIVKRDQEIKVREATFTEREAKIAAREAKIQESENLWDTDIFKALEARGYTYQKLTDLLLEGKTVAPESQDPLTLAKKTIEDFKKEQKAKEDERAITEKKAKEDAAKKQEDDLKTAWESYNAEVKDFVDSNKETYELISMYDQQALIADTVDAFYQKNKRVLSVKEAADMVESYLETEAKKALGSKKLGTTKASSIPPAEPELKEKAPTKTLNNSMQPTAASVLPAASEADRMKRAMAALDSKR